jgi:hypothetical protein
MARRPNPSETIAARDIDELLAGFREAAAIEFRLLDVERFIQKAPAEPQTWTIAVARLLKLLRKTPALEPFHEVCHGYLRAVFEVPR